MSIPAIQQQPALPLAQPPQSFEREKMIRQALQIAAVAAFIIAVSLAGFVIACSIPGVHILTAGAVTYLSYYLLRKADDLYDLNDPTELSKAQSKLNHLDMSKMIDLFPLETIFQYKMKDLDWLRARCVQELHKRKYEPIEGLRKHADSLLAYKIITPAMHEALRDDDAEKLDQIIPGNTIDLDKLFQP